MPFERIAKVVLPYVVTLTIVLFVLTYVPDLVLFLPNLLFGK